MAPLKLFGRGDNHKIKKPDSKRSLTDRQLRSRIHSLEREISALTYLLNQLDTGDLGEITAGDQKLVNKLAVGEIELFRLKTQLAGVLENGFKECEEATEGSPAAESNAEGERVKQDEVNKGAGQINGEGKNKNDGEAKKVGWFGWFGEKINDFFDSLPDAPDFSDQDNEGYGFGSSGYTYSCEVTASTRRR